MVKFQRNEKEEPIKAEKRGQRADHPTRSRFFLLAAAWVDPGGAPFSQLSNGVKDAMVGSTELVRCHVMTKTCRKAD